MSVPIELTPEQSKAVYHFAGGLAITTLATLIEETMPITTLDASVRASMVEAEIPYDDATWGQVYFEFVTGLCNHKMNDDPSLDNHYKIMSQMLSIAMTSVLNSVTEISVGLLPADGELESEVDEWATTE